jgi:hypothetical protein
LETSLLVAAGSEGQVNVSLDGLHIEVGHQRNVLGLDTLEGPSAEKLDLGGVLNLLVVTLNFSVYGSKLSKEKHLTFRMLVSHLLLYNQIFPTK